MPRILLASNNSKKLAELRRILVPLICDIEVLGLSDVAAYPEPAETEPTFQGNALIKARAALAASGLPALADDSGLCVDELNQLPGVLSARWSAGLVAGERDAANNALLLAQLADTPDHRRGAQFRCAVAFCVPGGAEVVRSGQMSGRILRSEHGSGGFGYDPLFAPDGYDVTAAELAPELKDEISHRAIALRAIVPEVLAVLG